MIPWPGGFNAWHEQPVMTLPSGSRIRNGQTVLLELLPYRDHLR